MAGVQLEALLADLDDAQRSAVTNPSPLLRIEAGAGSGKTRVLTLRIAHRIATRDADPRRVLALTFTRRAATELAERVDALGIHDVPTTGTFHAVARAQLRSWWSDRGKTPPRLIRSRVGFVRRLLVPAEQHLALGVAGELDWATARLIGPARYPDAVRAAARRTPTDPERIAEVFVAYDREKRRRGVFDFDDLLGLCARALRDDRAFAAAQRWRFRHLFVDEFQDLNPLQFTLLREWVSPESPDLCVVGDSNQAIYGWNGADASYLTDFTAHFAEAETVRLTRNYRSSPEVLTAAGAVLGAAATQRQQAVRPPGPAPTVSAHADERAEAHAITAAVRDANRVPGRSWNAQAVLVRTHAQVEAIEAALTEAGIPVRVRSRDDAETLPEQHTVERVMESGRDALEVVTFHAAKGLQWPVVHVAGVEDGLVPHLSAASAEARSEERRLLYVALTRAEREVHITWARRRSFRGVSRERKPSPWLAAVEGATGPAAVPDPPEPLRPAARTRRTHRPEPSRGLEDHLRDWRAQTARGARCAPHVVLRDEALAAIASARPTSLEQLAAVAGVGPMRANRFGESLLAIVAANPPARIAPISPSDHAER